MQPRHLCNTNNGAAEFLYRMPLRLSLLLPCTVDGLILGRQPSPPSLPTYLPSRHTSLFLSGLTRSAPCNSIPYQHTCSFEVIFYGPGEQVHPNILPLAMPYGATCPNIQVLLQKVTSHIYQSDTYSVRAGLQNPPITHLDSLHP